MEWRNLLGLIKQPAPTELSPSQPRDLDEVIREIESWKALVDGPGWKVLAQTLVDEANECTAAWTRGGLDPRESDRLASRVATIGWVLELPGLRLDDVVKVLNESREGVTATMADDLPIKCPIEEG